MLKSLPEVIVIAGTDKGLPTPHDVVSVWYTRTSTITRSAVIGFTCSTVTGACPVSSQYGVGTSR